MNNFEIVRPGWRWTASFLMCVATSLALFSADAFVQAQSLDSQYRLGESTATGWLWYISVLGLAGFYLQRVPGRLAMATTAFAGSAVSFASFVSSNRKMDVELRIADQEQVYWVAACFLIPALLLAWDWLSDRVPRQVRASIAMVSLSMLVILACVIVLPVFFVVLLAVSL